MAAPEEAPPYETFRGSHGLVLRACPMIESGPFEFPGIYPVTGLRIPASHASTGTAEIYAGRRESMSAPEDRIFLTSIIDLLRSKGYTVIEPTIDSIQG